MGYYLLDNPNPNGDHFERTAVRPIRGVVIHTAENVADTIGPDGGAESVANYGATAARSVSWHATVDKDSIIYMLPDYYKAYHVISYNYTTLGIEIACQASKWDTYPDDWVDATLDNAAEVVRGWCELYNIPMERITRAQYDAGGKGILAHRDLDPERRSDPGAKFPWNRFLQKIKGDEMVTQEDIDAIVKAVWAAKLGPSSGGISVATAVQRTYMASLDLDALANRVADVLAARLEPGE